MPNSQHVESSCFCSKYDICSNKKCDLPNVPLNIVKVNVPFAMLKHEMFHHCIIITCIIASEPANLDSIKCSIVCSKTTLHTFSVIFRQSVTHKSASARCRPSCRPGTRWNPIRSAQSLSVNLGPSGVSTTVP